MTTRTSIRPRDLSPAQRIILRKEDRGLVAIRGEIDAGVARQLTHCGIFKHRHGLIYEVTPVGQVVLKKLREEDAV